MHIRYTSRTMHISPIIPVCTGTHDFKYINMHVEKQYANAYLPNRKIQKKKETLLVFLAHGCFKRINCLSSPLELLRFLLLLFDSL